MRLLPVLSEEMTLQDAQECKTPLGMCDWHRFQTCHPGQVVRQAPESEIVAIGDNVMGLETDPSGGFAKSTSLTKRKC